MKMPETIQSRLLMALLLGLIIANLLIWHEGSAFSAAAPHRLLKVVFFDVGSGDSAYIEGPNGAKVLIDGGPPTGKVLTELGKSMPFGDINIDALVVTNNSIASYGGIIDVLKRYSVRAVVLPEGMTSNQSLGELDKVVTEKNVKKIFAREDTKIVLGNGAELSFVLSQDAGKSNPYLMGNLEYASTSIIFAEGVNKNAAEYFSAHHPQLLYADVLVLPGRSFGTSTEENFVRAVSPESVVITGGSKSEDVSSLLSDLVSHAYRTDAGGQVEFVSDGKNFSITQKEK